MFRQRRAVIVEALDNVSGLIKHGKRYVATATFTDSAGYGFVELNEVRTAGNISIPIRKEHFIVLLGLNIEASIELMLEKILSEPYKGDK